MSNDLIENDKLTVEDLGELVRPDPETGKLYWLHRPRKMFTCQRSCSTWNARFAGKEAFITASGNGYMMGRVFGKKVFAHRAIWALANGRWPSGGIDHINMVRSDNRLCNLREATKSENARNCMTRKHSASGLKGVQKCAKSTKWSARIRIHGKSVFLGRYDTPEQAHEAYRAAAMRLHGEFARFN